VVTGGKSTSQSQKLTSDKIDQKIKKKEIDKLEYYLISIFSTLDTMDHLGLNHPTGGSYAQSAPRS
jgi:hypothetical protein